MRHVAMMERMTQEDLEMRRAATIVLRDLCA
jgi:hypothetical protein